MATSTPIVKDLEVTSPPDDTVSCLRFSPGTLQTSYLVAGSWDNSVRCWEVDRNNGTTVPKGLQSMSGPVLDACWNDEGTKVFMASSDKTVNCWDLASNSAMQVAQHGAAVKTCHWIKAPNYKALMTTSWDRSIKFWDTRQPTPMLTITCPYRCYCADVDFPFAVVGTSGTQFIVYNLQYTIAESKRINAPINRQLRCVTLSRDQQNYPNCIIAGNSEGRVSIEYLSPANPLTDNFTFKAHITPHAEAETQGYRDVYAINDIKVHPTHGTVATVGTDGRFYCWDKDKRTRIHASSPNMLDQPMTCCAFNPDGHIFAYAVGYDWAKGHAYNNPQDKNKIYLNPCFEKFKRRPSTKT